MIINVFKNDITEREEENGEEGKRLLGCSVRWKSVSTALWMVGRESSPQNTNSRWLG